MNERQVDLGLGRGLQPGGLVVKDAAEGSECDVIKKECPGPRRRRKMKVIDASRAIIPLDSELSSDPTVTSLTLSLQLDSALSEVEVLRQEVESYSKQLASKHSAIRILRQELKSTGIQRDDLQERNTELRQDLTKEINRLQFELEYCQNNLSDSQQTWSQRFDRVCQENEKLQGAINARDSELRFIVEERSVLLRDRDELLALLDPSKRELWCASAASSSASALCAPLATIGEGESDIELAPQMRTEIGRSAIELAVLGACTCRGCSPCRCAQAAARLKRQVARSREEASEARQRAEDAYVVVDAYRNAFEEQLTRNRDLTMRLGQASVAGTGEVRGGRLRELVRWVSRQLHDLGGVTETPQPSVQLRRASTTENIPVSASPVRSLTTSTWSICESVHSAGPRNAGDEEGEEEERPGVVELAELGHEPSARARSPDGEGPLAAVKDLTEEQLIMLLLDKMCERTESAAHQRITAHVLKRPGAACGRKGTSGSASSGVYSLTSS